MSIYEKHSRVCDQDGYKATVMYYGPVAAAKDPNESWLGVVWDKSDRGKNDGSCIDSNGVLHRYFECSPGSGSFVKSSKVSTGRSVAEALQSRYVKVDAPTITDSTGKLTDSFVLTSKGNQKSIEFVGEIKIRKWQQIDVVDRVVLRDESISSIGENIFELAGHFKEIDLQDNLLYQWTDLVSLCLQLKELRSILLHGNKFQPLTTVILNMIPTGCFDSLRLLALNSCNISSWSNMELLGQHLPNIEELYLAGNDLSDLPYQDDSADPSDKQSGCTVFQNLRLLDLCGCKIEDWRQVLHFSQLPSLQELLLDSNPINSVRSCVSQEFPILQRVSMSATRLSSWKDVDALSTFPSLKQLRLSQIPLFSGKGASEVRPRVIARMKNLTFFNGSGISPRERTDAEKMYLRIILREIDETKSNQIDINIESEHPRYNELKSTYVHDVLPIGRVNENLSMAADMINVTFKNMSFSSGGTLEPISKRIPSSVTIARLRMMVKQMIGLDIKLQQLSLRIYKDAPPTLLDDDQSNLQYYGAIDGAEIFINESKPE